MRSKNANPSITFKRYVPSIVLLLSVMGTGLILSCYSFSFQHTYLVPSVEPVAWPNNAQKAGQFIVKPSATVQPVQQPVIAAKMPMRLQIPVLALDAAVEQVGLTSAGAMDTPNNPADVAWFDLGALPGTIGSSVIDGHLDWKNGQSAVFAHLDTMRPGDTISITDVGGMNTTFVVTKLQTYGQHESAIHIFSSSDGKSHLNLITCEGAWNNATQSYSDRLVVFADKKE